MFPRLGVVAEHADVNGVGTEDDAELGLLGRRLAVIGIDLDEVGRGLRAAPDGLVEVAVERDGLAGRQALGGNRAPLLRVGQRGLLGEGGCGENGEKQAEKSRQTGRG